MKAWDPEEMTLAGKIWEDGRNAVNAGKRDVGAGVKTSGATVAAARTSGMIVAAAAVKRRDVAAAAAVKRSGMTMMGAAVKYF